MGGEGGSGVAEVLDPISKLIWPQKNTKCTKKNGGDFYVFIAH